MLNFPLRINFDTNIIDMTMDKTELLFTITESRQVVNELTAKYQTLSEIAAAGMDELVQIKGMGVRRAKKVLAAIQLANIKMYEKPDLVQVKSSRDAYEILTPTMSDLPHEEFWVLYLNRSNKVIYKERHSTGGIAGTVADTKLVIRTAILKRASGIIIAHNHPSGNLRPSQADVDLTKNFKEAAKVVEVNLLDHIIITQSDYYSFADEGLI